MILLNYWCDIYLLIMIPKSISVPKLYKRESNESNHAGNRNKDSGN